MNESMLNFLPYLNQKVAGYLSLNNVTTLDASNYEEIVKAVCFPLPSCKKNGEMMLNAYSVYPRMLDGMFSVMLCDRERKFKVMEDFSCNEQIVEIRNFENDPDAPCQFEADWKAKIKQHCPGYK